jgi:hypothetical protein
MNQKSSLREDPQFVSWTLTGNTSQIPVCPILFERGPTRFAQSLTRGRPKIVSIGSSTTAGEGNTKAYPDRLLSFLQGEYPNPKITMAAARRGRAT